MVMARTNDAAVEAFCPKTHLRMLYADASETTRILARQHGDSPAAAAVLGRVLAGTAAAGIDFNSPGQRLVLSAEACGPIGGWRTELSGEGLLTGGLFEHAPETLRDAGDGSDSYCGPAAAAKATRLNGDGSVRSQIAFQCKPGAPEAFFTELFAAAFPTRVCFVSTLFDGAPDRARILALQLVHEGSKRAFKRVSKLFEDGTVAETLAFDATLPTLREVLGLPDLVTGPTRAVAFGCSCSRERVLAAYATEPREVLEGMLRPLAPRPFRCHLCGRTYEVTPEDLVRILQKKSQDNSK